MELEAVFREGLPERNTARNAGNFLNKIRKLNCLKSENRVVSNKKTVSSYETASFFTLFYSKPILKRFFLLIYLLT